MLIVNFYPINMALPLAKPVMKIKTIKYKYNQFAKFFDAIK